MMKRFYTGENHETGMWEVEREIVKSEFETEYKLVKRFATYEDLIADVKAKAKGTFEIIDGYHEVTITIVEGTVKSVYGCWEGIIDYTEEKIKWGVMERPDEDAEDYEVECTRCGDGGCVHCEPSFFM